MEHTELELFNHSVNLLELIEDTVSYYCDENRISVSYTHLTLPTNREV